MVGRERGGERGRGGLADGIGGRGRRRKRRKRWRTMTIRVSDYVGSEGCTQMYLLSVMMISGPPSSSSSSSEGLHPSVETL